MNMSRFGTLISPLPEPASLGVLLPYLAVVLALMVSVFHHRRLRDRLGDVAGMRLYFGLFFTLLLAVPVALVLVLEQRPGQVLADFGLAVGNHRLGLVLLAIGLPITVLISYVASASPDMRRQYPFSKAACSSPGSFVRYEIAYLLLYFTAWEFLYRGLLFFPLAGSHGFLAAASLTGALSTLHHIGHPDSELLGALVGGFVFGAVSLATGSVLYSLVLHASLGISDDLFIYLRYHRRS